MKKYDKAIKSLEVKVYNKGICFLCGKECKDHYCHYECALAYTDHKSKMLKEINENNG